MIIVFTGLTLVKKWRMIRRKSLEWFLGSDRAWQLESESRKDEKMWV
jgi:hypothetical protein